MATLKVGIDGRPAQKGADDVSKSLAKVQQAAKQTRDELGRFNKENSAGFNGISRAGVAAAAGVFAVLAGVNKAVRATAEAQKNFSQLEAAVKSTGGIAGFSARQLADMSEEMQDLTTFSDDAVQAMQGVLLTFTNLRGSQFKDAQMAVANMATRLGGDLKSAALQVGKALNDPIKGLSTLGRAGVQFSADQEEAIKKLVKTGEVAKAQTLILKELETQFGGSAVAARNTFGGALEGIKNQIDNLFELDGGLPGATKALNEFSDVLKDPALKDGIDATFGLIVTLAAEALSLFGQMAAGLAAMFDKGGNEVVNLDNKLRDLQKQRAAIAGGGYQPGSNPLAPQVWSQGNQRSSMLADIDNRIKELEEAQRKLGFDPNGDSFTRARQAARSGGKDLDAWLDQAEKDLKKKWQGEGVGQFAPPDKPYAVMGGDTGKSEEDKARERLEKLEELTRTSAERELATYNEKLTALDELRSKDLVTEEQYTLRRAEIQDEYYQGLEDDLKNQWEKQREQAERLNELTMTSNEKDVAAMEEKLAAIDALREQDLISEEQYQARKNEIQDEYLDKVEADLKKEWDKRNKGWLDVEEMTKQAARNMQDHFAEFLFDPLDKGFEGMLKGFVDVIRRMAAEAIAAQLFKKLFGDTGTGGGGGAGGGMGGLFGTILSSVFGGMRAEGGPVEPGKAYLVGEKGPELRRFSRGGDIVSNAGLAAAMGKMQGGAPNVTVTPQIINVRDPKEIPTALASNEGKAAMMNWLTSDISTIREVLKTG